MRIVINGRFLKQTMTGVQRVAIELTKELDKLSRCDEIVLAVPPKTEVPFALKNIKIIEIGKNDSNIWVQKDLLIFGFKTGRIILTFSGLSSFVLPGFCYAHDVTHFRYPESYNKRYRRVYDWYFRNCLKHSKRIFTVSQFSMDELITVYKLNPRKVKVIYNAYDSGDLEYNYSDNVLNRYGLSPYSYYLTEGSVNRHKNQKYIEMLSDRHKDRKFVVAGGIGQNTFEKIDAVGKSNMIYLGYVTDNDLKQLYHFANGFIFPSLYEGFGIPPLEAIINGCKKVAVSNIPVHKELYSKGIYYFDPKDIDTFDFDEFDAYSIGEETVNYYQNKYSWEKSAKKLYDNLCI